MQDDKMKLSPVTYGHVLSTQPCTKEAAADPDGAQTNPYLRFVKITHRCHESFRHFLRFIFFHFIPAPIHTSRLCSTRVRTFKPYISYWSQGRSINKCTNVGSDVIDKSRRRNCTHGRGKPSTPHAFCQRLPRGMFCRCLVMLCLMSCLTEVPKQFQDSGSNILKPERIYGRPPKQNHHFRVWVYRP